MEQLLFNNHNFLSSSEAGGPKLNTAHQQKKLSIWMKGKRQGIKKLNFMQVCLPCIPIYQEDPNWNSGTPIVCSIRVVYQTSNSLILAH